MSDLNNNGAAADAIDEAAMEGAEIGARARDDVKQVQGAFVRKSAEIVDRVGKKLSDAGVDTDQMIAVAKGQVGDLRSAFISEIQSRPVQAVAAAALAGLVVGFLSAR